MTRIQVISDIHAEVDFRRSLRAVTDLSVDLVILAGDIDEGGSTGVRWAANVWPETTPIVYVAGNHEHYGSTIETVLSRARAVAEGQNIHVLERESVTIQGVRILGATLWTDLALAGDLAFARWRLGQAFSDYRAINSANGGRLRPAETEAIHHETVQWLDQTLAEPHDGPTIVVTHHAPSPRSLLQWNDPAGESPWTVTDAAFASHLDWLIERHQPALWIHGHTHMATDYQIGNTRVLSNPRGYFMEGTGWDSSYVLDLSEGRPV